MASVEDSAPILLSGPQMLHELINWERHNDKLALEFQDGEKNHKYTYRELRSCVKELAHQIGKGLHRETTARPIGHERIIIPLFISQSPALYIAQLAILTSGAAFCPISLDAPPERIAFILRDVEARIVITTEELAERLEADIPTLVVKRNPEVPRDLALFDNRDNSSGQCSPDHHELAYVQFTSGSTGTPKGVAVGHLAVTQALLAHDVHLPPFNRFLQFAAPTFDVSIFETYFPLFRGSTLVGCEKQHLVDHLPDVVNSMAIDAMELTPTVVSSLLPQRSMVPGLRILITIGEMLTKPIVEEYGGNDHQESLLYAAYGPVEAAIHCTLVPRMRTDMPANNIGKPFDTVKLHIAAECDEHVWTFKSLGPDDIGELVLEGPQLAMEYLNRPKETHAAFFEHEGKRHYRTGDKARLLPNGSAEIFGRMVSGQVKIRGQRIELGEIENVMYQYPGVKNAVALIIDSTIIAFMTVSPSSGVTEDDVLNTCRSSLLKYMVPSTIIILDSFPRLPSGKVDRREIESSYRRQLQAEEEEAAQETSTVDASNSSFTALLKDLLPRHLQHAQLASISVDSLTSIRLAHRLRSHGYSISAIDILQCDTVAQLEAKCEQALQGDSVDDDASIPSPVVEETAVALNGHAKDVEHVLPCTPLQNSLLADSIRCSGSYWNWVDFNIRIADVQQAREILLQLVKRTPILRTGFMEAQGNTGFVQIVWQDVPESCIQVMESVEDAHLLPEKLDILRPLRCNIKSNGSEVSIVMQLHHAQYDAWSVELMLDDLDSIIQNSPAHRNLDATCSDNVLPWRPAFHSIAHNLKSYTAKETSETSKQYWSDELDGLSHIRFPCLHANPPPKSAVRSYRATSSLTTSVLDCTARSLRVGPQALIQAAYSIVLAGYLDVDEVTFGSVFSGRHLPIDGILDVVGPIFATLPLRVQMASTTRISELAQAVDTTNRRHLLHSILPPQDIKAALNSAHDQPLFDTLFVWQQTLHELGHARKHVDGVDTVDHTTFALIFEATPGPEQIAFRVTYDAALVPEAQVVMFLGQVEHVVQTLIHAPERRVQDVFGDLSLDCGSAYNISPTKNESVVSLSSPVEELALSRPDAVAIEFAQKIQQDQLDVEKITYAELNSFANSIARHLCTLAIDIGRPICIYLEKSIGMYSSILAVVKLGLGYMPVTPDTPPERLRTILHEADVRHVFVDSETSRSCSFPDAITAIDISRVKRLPAFEENVKPFSTDLDGLAYLINTSGSTGTPKGVQVTKRNLLSNLSALVQVYPGLRDARVLQSCSQAFDVSVFEIFFTWRIGGCLCSAVKDELFRDLARAVRSLRITHLSLTPTVAGLLRPDDVPSVKCLVTAGEGITEKVFSEWAGKGLYQGYGPAETCNICTLKPDLASDDNIRNIGRALANTSAFVIAGNGNSDNGLAFMPRGAVGEFVFGGEQVFRGYLNRSQENSGIIEHPIFGRLYRSGDFGRMLHDGSLIYSHRRDMQVKVNGIRIELGEVSAVLQSCEDVRSCWVQAVLGEDGRSKSLVAFWTGDGDVEGKGANDLDPKAEVVARLFETLRAKLPAYMVPAALIPLGHLPQTAQGKIDQRALSRVYHDLDAEYLQRVAQLDSSDQDDVVWTSLEEKIASALRATLQRPDPHLGPSTSFFSIGIDSLSAIALARRIQAETGCEASISAVMQHSSIRRLARYLDDVQAGTQSTQPVKGNASRDTSEADFKISGLDAGTVMEITTRFQREGKTVEQVLPVTPLQEAMLSASAASESNAYLNHTVFRLNGDAQRLKTCWLAAVKRHQILRTCFEETDVGAHPHVQVVLDGFEPRWEYVELGDEADVAARLQKLVSCTTMRTDEPPYMFTELTAPRSASQLVLTMHHALYDAVAMSILFDEVQAQYREQQLAPTSAFASFLQMRSSLDLQAADAFWQEALEHVQPTRLARRQEADGHPFRETSVYRHVSRHSRSWLEHRVQQLGTTLTAFYHTIWAAVLADLLRCQNDICFGSVVSGRNTNEHLHGDFDRLVAPCFNTIPIRLDRIDRKSYLEGLRQLHASHAAALPYHLTPLRRIQQRLSPDGSRLFDTLFILQQAAMPLDQEIWTLIEDHGAMNFPLVFEVVPGFGGDDALLFLLHAEHAYVSPDEAASICAAFDTRISTALENPRQQLLSTQVKQAIVDHNSSRNDCPPDTARHRMRRSSTNAISHTNSPTEELARTIISTVLQVDPRLVHHDTNLFRLGLDSINAVQIARQLTKGGHPIGSAVVLTQATVASISTKLANALAAPDGSTEQDLYDFASFDKEYRQSVCERYSLLRENVESILPCTPLQAGMLARSTESGVDDYWNEISFRLAKGLTIQGYRAAWHQTARRHSILRTGFVRTNDSEHQFAMVTRRAELFELPWYEGGKHDAPSERRDLLRPWSLVVSHAESGGAVVKLRIHHALYDAHSLRIILDDVYDDSHQGKRSTDAIFIQPLLSSILLDSKHNLVEKEKFWTEQQPVVTNRFPTLTPLVVRTSTQFTRSQCSKFPALTLESLCKAHGVTLQAALQAMWARMLASYVGEEATTFGITLSGRSLHHDTDHVAFPAIVTLPITLGVSGTNSDLLQRSLGLSIAVQKHQSTRLRDIQRWAGSGDVSLFDTLLIYQKSCQPRARARDDGWHVVEEVANVDYSVSLEVEHAADGTLLFLLTSRDNIIPPEQVDLMLRQCDALLRDLLERPEANCDECSALDQDLLAITTPEIAMLEGPASLLHDFLDLGCQNWPDRPAIEFATSLSPQDFRSTKWTYRHLNEHANRVANCLVEAGVVPGQFVAILFDKCPEASFAIAGIMKAGAIFVALDPNSPLERLRFILKDCAAPLVLTAGEAAKIAKESLSVRTIVLDSTMLAHCSTEPPRLAREITPQDTSYSVYTSGTTGVPKGCLVSHESAVQMMYSFSRLFAGHWDEHSKWLQFASFHFDVCLLEQFWTWSVGMCMASAPRDLILEDLAGAIRRMHITHIDLTPSLARLLRPEDVPSLCKGVFVTGGESLKQEIIDAWGEQLVIYNGYGPSECTSGCTMYCRVPANGKPSNIGPAWANAGTYVVKPHTESPVLRGGVGELLVSGTLVGQGYVNRPELTTEKFPTLQKYDDRIYRTGDIVRILHNGDILCLGRADDQVKLRGQRLELTEINKVVQASHASVQEVVTLLLKHKAHARGQLVNFYVAAEQDLGPVIKRHCRSRLPGYMVPSFFVPVQRIPLNANHKADGKQLAALFHDMSMLELQRLDADDEGEPWRAEELPVVAAIASFFHVEVSGLSRNSTVFQVGLDSISMTSFVDALVADGFTEARVATVKNHPVLHDLVAALLQAVPAQNGKESAYLAARQRVAVAHQKHLHMICGALDIDAGGIQSIAPCTPVQEGMIYTLLGSQDLTYFHTFEFQLRPHVDIEKLRSAWERVVQRVEMLRTEFILTTDGFVQCVLKQHIASASKPDYGRMERSQVLREPYYMLFPSSGTDSMMMQLTIFHGLYDGLSLEMVLSCFAREYHGDDADYGPSFIDALAYGPLALSGGARDFWQQYFREKPPRHMLTSTQDTEVVVVTNTVTVANFEHLRRILGVTPQSMVQACWLACLTGEFSFTPTIGLVTSGRSIDYRAADKVLGPLFNTVPFSTTVNAEPVRLTIQACHDFNLKMQDYQHTPLKDIQKWAGCKSGESLFDNVFVFQRSNASVLAATESLWMQVDTDRSADHYPLALEATLSEDETALELLLVSRETTIDRDRANTLLQRMSDLLQLTIAQSGENLAIEPSTTQQYACSELPDNLPPKDVSVAPSKDNTNQTRFEWSAQATKIRHEIAALAEVDIEAVDEHTALFSLGLDSIDTMKLAGRLRGHAIHITVSDIIKCQDIVSMVQTLQQSKSDTESTTSDLQKDINLLAKRIQESLQSGTNGCDNIVWEDIEAVLPATPLQQTMYHAMLDSNFGHYLMLEVFHLSDGLDITRFARAVDQVVANSPILRTGFVAVHDTKLPVTYAQLVHRHRSVLETEPRRYHDIEDCKRHMKAELLNQAKACRTAVYFEQCEIAGNVYFGIAMCHACYDGTSLRFLHEDIRAAYAGESAQRPRAELQLARIMDSSGPDAQQYWQQELHGFPGTWFPRRRHLDGQHHRPRVMRSERVSACSHFDAKSICRRMHITMQSLGQTCWSLVLAHLLKQEQVTFGAVLACRDSEEAARVMFPMMNTTAVHSVIHGTFAGMMRYIQERSDASRPYQHFPLARAMAMSMDDKQAAEASQSSALFESLFIYQGQRDVPLEHTLYTSIDGNADVDYPVCAELEVVDDALVWTVACDDQVEIENGADGVIDKLEAVLRIMLEEPESPAILVQDGTISIASLPPFHAKTLVPAQATPSRDLESPGWSDMELSIRTILGTASGHDEASITRQTSVFQLGFDSISALKLPPLFASRGISITVGEILRHSRLDRMARMLQSRNGNSMIVDTVDVDGVVSAAIARIPYMQVLSEIEVEPDELSYIMPATAGQVYMIRQWQRSRGWLCYYNFKYKLPASLGEAVVEKAWEQLLQRHDILRTGFIEVEQAILQITYKEPMMNLQSETRIEDKNLGLHLPPVSMHWQHDPTSSDIMLNIRIHHALYDGISLAMVINDLKELCSERTMEPSEQLYKSYVAHTLASGTGPTLVNLPTADTRRNASGGKGNAPANDMERLWSEYLAGIPSIPSAILRAAPTRRVDVYTSDQSTLKYHVRARADSMTVDALLLASTAKAYAALLSDSDTTASSSESLIMGVYLANRAPFNRNTHLDFSKMVAPTFNILPLRVSRPLDTPLALLAQSIQYDIARISDESMVFASLEEIYRWTGVCVNFCVNILKDAPDSASGGDERDIDDREWHRMDGDVLKERRDVIDAVHDEKHIWADQLDSDMRLDAYLPTIDVELRYHRGQDDDDDSASHLDIGIFGPVEMITLAQADVLAQKIRGGEAGSGGRTGPAFMITG